ncbi:MAG TPA: response regulator [Telluria sp.]|nr:response regulator [Telluria sp.]
MKKTILIVDDSASLRQVVAMTLERAGYEVAQAANGKDALAAVEGKKIHLVISDVNMPVMDGITFVTELKKLPAFRFVPVVMLTTESGEGRMRAGMQAGVKAWVVKPFQPVQMLAAVARLIAP